jgi:uncharacterized membrane protein YdbT with pleckstrin-like domain
MKYLNKTLTKGEKVVVNAKMSKWSLLFPILLALPTLGISLLIGLIRRATTEYGVTNNKVLSKTGLIKRDTDELRTIKIEGVDVTQGVLGRIFGYGNLVFSGTGSQSVTFKMVSNPLDLKKQVQETF